MDITEKTAYLKGLLEGMDLDDDKKEVKILNEMADVLNLMAKRIEGLDNEFDDVYEELDVIDEHVEIINDELFGSYEFDRDRAFYEITCPTCNEEIVITDDMLDLSLIHICRCRRRG
eukprot:TRINITY_DN6220_c0_g1_i22.p1 TRINITY_DN6220_c0_g1~~TRINITY_DN6220_c0_g1_i22.p1  ORF type:complete len:117 (-),score=4.83 TRINITY_DN6220_c0_g1_i22:25-375(-)